MSRIEEIMNEAGFVKLIEPKDIKDPQWKRRAQQYQFGNDTFIVDPDDDGRYQPKGSSTKKRDYIQVMWGDDFIAADPLVTIHTDSTGTKYISRSDADKVIRSIERGW